MNTLIDRIKHKQILIDLNIIFLSKLFPKKFLFKKFLFYIIMILPKRNTIVNRKLKLQNRKYIQQIDWKPEGFWYSCGNEWYNWVKIEMPEWLYKYIYRIDVINKTNINKPNKDKLLILSTIKDFNVFINKYKENRGQFINWKKVSKDFGGIEICPYSKKLANKYQWYETWDVASGCIWNYKPIIKKISLIHTKETF